MRAVLTLSHYVVFNANLKKRIESSTALRICRLATAPRSNLKKRIESIHFLSLQEAFFCQPVNLKKRIESDTVAYVGYMAYRAGISKRGLKASPHQRRTPRTWCTWISKRGLKVKKPEPTRIFPEPPGNLKKRIESFKRLFERLPGDNFSPNLKKRIERRTFGRCIIPLSSTFRISKRGLKDKTPAHPL